MHFSFITTCVSKQLRIIILIISTHNNILGLFNINMPNILMYIVNDNNMFSFFIRIL